MQKLNCALKVLFTNFGLTPQNRALEFAVRPGYSQCIHIFTHKEGKGINV